MVYRTKPTPGPSRLAHSGDTEVRLVLPSSAFGSSGCYMVGLPGQPRPHVERFFLFFLEEDW